MNELYTCDWCGKEYRPKWNNQQFCGGKCEKAAKENAKEESARNDAAFFHPVKTTKTIFKAVSNLNDSKESPNKETKQNYTIGQRLGQFLGLIGCLVGIFSGAPLYAKAGFVIIGLIFLIVLFNDKP